MRRAHWIGLALLLIAALVGGIYAGAYFTSPENGETKPPSGEQEEEEPPAPDIRTATVLSVGTTYPHKPQLQQAHLGGGKYDFSPSFEIIAPLVKEADLAIATLETAQAGAQNGGYTSYPLFNSPIELSEAFKEAGFDIFNTANNHIMDRGYRGLMDTLDSVRALGLKTFGTSKSWEEWEKPFIVEVNGIKLGLISYTYNINGVVVPAGHEYAINHIENFYTIEPIKDDIEKTRRAGADLIALYLHMGEEYLHEPTPAQKEMVRELTAAGADMIIGTHTHVPQPLEWIRVALPDGSVRRSLVAYTLGNFCTNQHLTTGVPTDLTRYGLLTRIKLGKDMNSGESWIEDVDYEVYICQINWRHRVIPVSFILNAPPEKYHHSEARVQTIRRQHEAVLEIVERYGFSAEKGNFLPLKNSN